MLNLECGQGYSGWSYSGGLQWEESGGDKLQAYSCNKLQNIRLIISYWISVIGLVWWAGLVY